MRTVPGPGAHGGDGRRVAAALGLPPDSVLDLSASCNPFAPDPAPYVVRHIEAGALTRYPDETDERRATASMAEALGVDPGRVLLTNGGSEAIALVAGELARGWVDDPEFSLYRRHLGVVEPGAPRFRSDPHNPTGRLAGDGEEADVWDEAFYPLATGRWTRAAAGTRPGGRDRPAVVVGSLTKVFGCPGLRLGYVVTPPDGGRALGRPGLHRHLADRRPQWSVATPALLVLPDLLRQADLAGWSAAIARARRQLVSLLAEHGLSARPSAANFVLVDGTPSLRERLARRGVVVRDCASFGLAGSVRIAVPDGAGLARLAEALGGGEPGCRR